MIKTCLIAVLWCLPLHFALANCDLKSFKWHCDLPIKQKPTQHSRSLVYCGNTPLYITQSEYKILRRYQRANVNQVLRLNGAYITSPCVPAGRQVVTYKP